jgi:hypothetical protein
MNIHIAELYRILSIEEYMSERRRYTRRELLESALQTTTAGLNNLPFE